MSEQKYRKIKKLLGSFSLGAIAAGSIIPVVACGLDESNSFVEDLENVKSKLESLETTENGVSNLPQAPEGTYWEYRVDDGEFSPAPPVDVDAGQEVSVKLVVSDDEVLADAPEASVEEVEVTLKVTEKVSPSSDLETKLAEASFDTNGKASNLPNAPENSHWEYGVNGNAELTSDLASVPLEAGDNLLVRLVANSDYELTESIEANFSIRQTVLISNDLQTALDKVRVSVSEGMVDLPIVPDNTHWEFSVSDGEFVPNSPTSGTLNVGQKVAVKLVANDNYVLSDPVLRDNIITSGTSLPANLENELAGVTISPNGEIANLPELPTNAHWKFSIDGGINYDTSLPAQLDVGAHVIVKTFASENHQLEKILQEEFVVTSEIDVTGLQAKLDQAKASTSGFVNLPVAPDNAYWIIKTGTGESAEYIDEFSSDLLLGETINIQLVANNNYFLTEPVKRENITVRDPINLDNDGLLSETTLDANEGIINLPSAPDNTHWKYKVNDDTFYTDELPTDILEAGTKVLVTLTADSNYELTNSVEKTLYAQQVVSIDDNLLEKFMNVTAEIGNLHSIQNLPDAPEHTRWQYALGDASNAEYMDYHEGDITSDLLASNLNLKMRLVADENYYLSTPVERTAIAIIPVSVNTSELTEAFEEVIVDVDRGVENLPQAPANTLWVYSKNNDPDFQEEFPVNLKVGDSVTFMLKQQAGILENEKTVKKTITVTGTVDTDNLANKLARTTVFKMAGVLDLPPAPANSHWMYSTDNGTTYSSDITTSNLAVGTAVNIKLEADDNYFLKADVSQNFFVSQKIDPNITLNEVAITTSDGITGLPETPNGTHWEYQIDGGEFTTLKPTNLPVSTKVGIKLTANSDNYQLLSPVERDNIFVTEQVDIPTSLQTDLDNLVIDENTSLKDLTNPPAHTHWEYQLDNGAFLASLPTNLQVGQKVAVRLVAENVNYHLTTTVERSDIIVSEHVAINPLLQEYLDNLLSFQPLTGVGILNNEKTSATMPEAPEHTHWEFRIGDGEFTTERPTSIGEEFYNGTARYRLEIKLVSDVQSGYLLDHSVSRKIDVAKIYDSSPVEMVVQAWKSWPGNLTLEEFLAIDKNFPGMVFEYNSVFGKQILVAEEPNTYILSIPVVI